MTANLLLESYLKQLRLPMFLQNYSKFAEDAAQANLTYDRFLLSLAEQEVLQRDVNREIRRIKAARFPVLKELADFDFSCVSSLNKAQVLDLARGAYIQKAENIILVGNPGLGKPQPIKYPYRCDICARAHGHHRRSTAPTVWSHAATSRHYA
ncbi:MAG: ATP-binding protein, partial [Caldilineales bacterium]|nr:ATP-binding protein [Caldilineales bacterium]